MKKMSIEEAIKHLGDVNDAVFPALEQGMRVVCTKITDDIKESMAKTTRDSSRSYHTHNKKIPHHPSAPGNPPAPDTGNLRNSIRFSVENAGNAVKGRIGSTQNKPPYGAYLEYGTSNILPRPWLAPAIERNTDFMRDTFSSAVQKAVEGK